MINYETGREREIVREAGKKRRQEGIKRKNS